MRRGLTGALLAVVVLALAACGSPPVGTFKPGGGGPAGSVGASPTTSAAQPASSVVMPSFGHGARVVVDPYTGSTSAAGAVVTAKNFLLAVLYSYYTGGRDQGWKTYTDNQQVLTFMSHSLSGSAVTTGSWTGTIVISHMSAGVGNFGKNTALVSFCEDDAGAKNTSLSSHQVLPPSQQTQGNRNYYLVSYELSAGSADSWTVTAIQPNQYYPRPPECKP